jgi:hypothetical protein
MKLKDKILILAALAAVAAGCNPAEKFAIVEAPLPVLHGLTALNGRAVVENSGSRDLMIENARVTLRYRDRELTTARLLLPVAIPAHSAASVRYDLALEGLTLADMQTLSSRALANPAAVTVDVDAWIRWGGIRRKIERRGVEAAQLIETFYVTLRQ